MKRTPAIEIAKYFISSFQKSKKEISNLKLQKLLYYAQAWHLALYGTALFDDKIEAWVHGPVIRSIFQEYRKFGWKPIHYLGSAPTLSDNIIRHLKEVVSVYGNFDAVSLERMTHGESPWRDARGNLSPDEPSNRVITLEAMKKFYSARLHE